MISGAWSGRMLTWFFSHMVALVGDPAGFLVPLWPAGLPPQSPPCFFSLFVSVTGAWTSGMGAHGWIAGIASHGSGTRSRGWLASSGSPWTSLAPNLHCTMQLLGSAGKLKTSKSGLIN